MNPRIKNPGRLLLPELKRLYDELSGEERACLREQFTHCAENCVPKEDTHV